jgi:hypothetical protein
MKKLRYLAYDFDMQPIEKRGQLIVPVFEKGRILVKQGNEESRLFLMKRPANLEEELHQASGWELFQKTLASLGWVMIKSENKSGYFEICVRNGKRSKRSGTFLMNASATYGQALGLESLHSEMTFDKDTARRLRFFKDLEMWPGKDGDKNLLFSYVNAPKLNQIEFERNLLVEEIMNSLN